VLRVLIRNGQVVDGSEAPRYRADVAVEGDRIVEIGGLEGARAEAIVDAAGCVVTPGFVDMHSHTDLTLPLLPTADSLVHQGITTAVVGQCGMSPAPLFAESREQVVAAMEDEDAPLPWDRWSSFGSYLDYLGRMGTSINVVPLVGQGTVRAGIMGFVADPADGQQIVRMQTEVQQAMDEGAIGVSTGLIYPPGSYASTEELIAVTRPVGRLGGFYFSHIRGEGTTLLTAVAEAIRIGRETGASVQISHFKASGPANWRLSGPALELIEQARVEGLDVSADLYPYVASSTGLKAALPQWAQEGGNEATLERLADSETRRRMAEDMQPGGYAAGRDWSSVLISSSPRNRAYEGRTVGELAADSGKAAHDWIFDALLETELQLQMISFGMSEENRRAELRYPPMMIGTDGTALATEGTLARGKPHPRSFGTFPRVLGYYVRQQEVIPLEEAVHKMTGLPARKLRWTNRGLVKKGYTADLVVLNPETVSDRATFEHPHQYPAGIQAVIVNGAIVVRDSAHTGARPGEVLGR
jgi:N-acyl-D-amino-acid deacylase